jgi:hypothetical protein
MLRYAQYPDQMFTGKPETLATLHRNIQNATGH